MKYLGAYLFLKWNPHGLFDGRVTDFVNIVIIPLLSLSAITS
jgi:hypothetical protein